ncbi:efflux RND transporter permease subunit [Aurantimonas sp. Leaf443]|uniref:efflux RND transporter permease subunit n=1 Tax=Aurantimonas sp. Leaf443 TaxID=1736378 RepID=UPI0006FFA272|nr:efflux RND transporter permease subunit [Aurantimonas sp. Leaf443]KQT83081.1 ABC transporter permease [Aurantimonas sp. Leaf443]
MNVSAWSIRNPVPPVAIFLALMAIGLVAFLRLPVTRFPNIDVPFVVVTIVQPGSGPAEIMNQIGQPVEDSLQSVSGIKHVTTIAADGASTNLVEFDLEVDPQRAVNDVKDAISRIRSDLPGSANEPIVQRLDIAGLPILTYAVTDPTKSIAELSYFIDDAVKRAVQGQPSVGDIRRIGGLDEQVNVDLDPDRLAALGISAASVSEQLSRTNINLGGGRGDLGAREFSIRAIGSSISVEALSALPIALGDGRSVRLDALGTIRDGGADVRSYAQFDGEPVVAFQVIRSSGGSDTEAADSTHRGVERLKAEFPSASFTLIEDSAVYTRGNYDRTMHTLYEGAALAVLVVFLFLRDWRATLIAGVALPLSIIPTFFAMSALGFTLNQISLLAITLVTGILVDDAIVEIENIERHMAMGKGPYEASMEAADEIGLTVIAISSTIVAVFAPVSFMSGIAGQYFKQFGLTVAISVLFSLAVARFVTPMMAAYLMKPNTRHQGERRDGFVMRWYLAFLRGTLRHRWLTLVVGLLFFAGSIFSATLIPTTFIPEIDDGRSVLSLELPPGARTADNIAATQAVVAKLETIPGIANVLVSGGASPNTQTDDGANPTNATVSIFYAPKAERDLTKFEIESLIEAELADIPDIRTYFANDNGQRAVSISLLSSDRAAVEAYADRLIGRIADTGLVKNATSGASLLRPEVQIRPRPEVAAELGVTASAIAQTIRVSTIGDVDAALAKYNRGDRQVPIVVRLDASARDDLWRLRNLKVQAASGAMVPLGVVADITLGTGPTTLERYDRQNRVTIGGDLPAGTPLGSAIAAIDALPDVKSPPPGVRVQPAGDAEVMEEVFTGFALALGAGILMVYAVLVLLFGSFLSPMTILMSLPLSVGGAILGLYLANDAISLPVVIGFLMLMGIVTKNAIMLVEFALKREAEGATRAEAILDAAHKRARPIVMTTIAMVAGMVPSAIGLGEGGEFRSPMAVAVIGGLIVSTALSLVFIPTLHSFVEGFGTRLRRRLGRLVNAAPKGEPQPAE